MDIVFLYGNGFDRALDLETSYSDFLRWAAENRTLRFTPSAFEFLDVIKKHEGDASWMDFESAIGMCRYDVMSFCQGFSSLNYATNVVFGLQDLMRAFLSDAWRRLREVDIPDLVGEIFVEGFNRLCYENGVSFDPSIDRAHVVTLNYTKTLETLLRKDVVFHPHGTLDSHSPIIFGVDSNKQLKHLEIGEFSRLICKCSQIEENTISGLSWNEELMRWIGCADVFILFGLSFGPTDYRIWENIGRHSATTGAKIVLCPFGEDVSERFKRGMCQWGLCDDEIDGIQLSLWPTVSKNIIVANDSRSDFLGLGAIKQMLF